MSAADWLLGAGLVLSLALTLALHRRQAALERRLRHRSGADPTPAAATALRHLGLVRYRAFDDIGGDHSFALSLADAAGNGVVVNGIYHRDRCRVYAKPLQGWRSDQTLTDEEAESVRRAQEGDASVDIGVRPV